MRVRPDGIFLCAQPRAKEPYTIRLGSSMLEMGSCYCFANMKNSFKKCVSTVEDFFVISSQDRMSACGVSFLLDESDTVSAYERKGRNNEQKHEGNDPLMSALDNLNRVQQLEIIHGKQYDISGIRHICGEKM